MCQFAYFLDDHGFLILAEKAAEGVGDFADRSVGFDGIEDGREKIFRCVGTALEFGKGGGHAVRIATGAESFEPGDLRALDFLVNAQRANLPGFFADEIVDADDDLLFFLDRALKFERDFLDFRLNKTRLDGAQHAA